jgi:hypothetical protein
MFAVGSRFQKTGEESEKTVRQKYWYFGICASSGVASIEDSCV